MDAPSSLAGCSGEPGVREGTAEQMSAALGREVRAEDLEAGRARCGPGGFVSVSG